MVGLGGGLLSRGKVKHLKIILSQIHPKWYVLKKIGEDSTDYFLYFVLSLTGLPTLPLLHWTSLKPLTCQYIQFPATLTSHHIWVPECFKRKITKYKTLQIVATINPWLASWIWASVMPGNPISFSPFIQKKLLRKHQT